MLTIEFARPAWCNKLAADRCVFVNPFAKANANSPRPGDSTAERIGQNFPKCGIPWLDGENACNRCRGCHDNW
jgi:hypothetical protein